MRVVLQRARGAFLRRSGFVKAYGNRVMSFGDGSQGALGQSEGGGSVASDAYEPLSVEALPDNILKVAAGHYHSLAITADGQLWSWGRNTEGQLGRASDLSWKQSNHPQIVDGLESVEIKDAAGSGVVTMAIDAHGSLWAWGRSKRGQLGLGEMIVEAPFPQRVQALSGHQIVQVSLGWGHTLACTAEGKVFSWGYPLDGRLGYLPKGRGIQAIFTSEVTEHQMDLLDENVKQELNILYEWKPQLVPLGDLEAIGVSCGLDHSLIICKGGAVLSFGDNSYGQLGRKQGAEDSVEDWRVELEGSVSGIGSGLGHSLAVCHSRRQEEAEKVEHMNTNFVHSWGWNSAFQLGRTTSNERPMQVEGLHGCQVLSVDGGRVHSAAIDSKGGLWTWGSGRNGRLGLGSFGDEQDPCPVESIQEVKVQQVACGMDHTVILVID